VFLAVLLQHSENTVSGDALQLIVDLSPMPESPQSELPLARVGELRHCRRNRNRSGR